LRRFYCDTAQAAMSALRAVVDVSHVLFGTDFAYRHGAEYAQGLQTCGFTPQELAAIGRGNAARLLWLRAR
jgi:predicted TIM-barrel fold metal-dependent hydrolase